MRGMTFHTFASYLARIEETSLRNEITQILAELFTKLEPDEIESTCWLLLGRILPPYEGLEFQFADKMMMRASANAYEIDLGSVQSEYKKIGDLAIVIAEYSKTQTVHSKKTITEIYQELRDMAKENGEGSQERKVARVVDLLKELDSVSVKYVVRIILTRLRLGFSDMTILDALSWAKMGDKSQRKLLEDTYQLKNDIGKLAKAYLTHGEKGLEHFDIELGIPLQPALCQRLKTAVEMIEKMNKVFAEPKYDGTRVQIHIQGERQKGKGKGEWTVRTFTRSMEESSAQFPELPLAVKSFGAHDLILDCEAIGFDPKTGKLLPFQETIQRKRKHDIEAFSKNIPLRFFVFDVLYKDGKSLIRLPLHERKIILHELIAGKDLFVESPYIVTDSADVLREFHTKQLAAGLEGAVIKQYDSVYQPGRRGWSWVKFKEAEGTAAKLSDTVDAVVMGYWYGKGKRNQFGVGAFLIGVANGEQIVTLSKVGTGLSDDQWRELKTRCEVILSADQPKNYVVDKLLIPDVWVDPSIVVEVAGDELTKSPNHSAGLALRFPRLIRFRDDKTTKQLTTVEELKSIK
jgi:DNA ligase 1